MPRMSASEAFVETLVANGVKNVFGIVGSAYMDALDLFPTAGIRFIPTVHEQGAGHMADGYARVSGKHGVCIAQNGPGITNFVTCIKTAYWNHTPMLLVTPQAANRTIGQGGFQEVEQMALFRDMVCYQEEVRDPARIAEVLNRVITKARRLSAPAQINVPRDYWTQVVDIDLPQIVRFERPAGGAHAVAEAAKLLSEAKFPVILSGGAGTRLWPLSREGYPKQFLPLVAENTLFQETVLRARHVQGCGAPIVVARARRAGEKSRQYARTKTTMSMQRPAMTWAPWKPVMM